MTKFRLQSLLAVLSIVLSSTAFAQLMKLPGEFAVSSSGAATYSIPIQVPPGTAGMEPALSLDYSSQSGNGLLGLGWSLNGLPTIDRCPRTIAQDGVKGSVNFDANDRFCMGGQRLVAISGTYGSANTEYRTEVDSFAKIISYGSAGSGPQYFKVWTKTGQIMEFGNTSDSRLLKSTTVRTWHVNKISDTSGNYLTVTYTNDPTNHVVYPITIDYTMNSGLPAYNSVDFIYSSGRLDQHVAYEAGASSKLPYLLTNVKTYEGTNLVFDYQISYTSGTGVRPSRISSVTLCDDSSNCLPSTTFTWPSNNDPLGFTTPSVTGVSPLEFTGDYNGDGLPDFLEYIEASSSAQAHYWMSTTPGAWSSVDKSFPYTMPDPYDGSGNPLAWVYLPAYPNDLDADGYTDAVVDEYGAYEETVPPPDENILHSWGPTRYSININDGTGVLTQAVFGDGDANGEATPVGDLNGDGRDDMLYLQASNAATPYFSDGDGTYTAGSTISGLYSSAYIFPGDFNGDGCMDILAQGSSSKIYFSCNAPVSSVTVTNWVPNQYKIVLGDYNADGNTDVLAVRDGYNSKLYLSDGTDLIETSFSGPTDWVKYRIQSGDFNGDMLADLMLIAFSTDGSNYGPTTTHKIYLSTGEGFSYSTAITNPSGTMGLFRVHDYNGDGVVDFWNTKTGTTSENKLTVTNYNPMMISAISDGLGQTTSIEYDRLNNNTATYTKGSSATYPDMDVIGAQYVVKEVDVPNGVGTTNTFAYKYEGARYNHQGRLLLGFKKQIITDPNGIVQTTTFKQDYPYIGKVESVTQVKSGVTLSSITNTYQNTTPTPAGTGGQRRYVKLYQTVEATKDLDGTAFPTITTTYTYDSYGNPLTVVVSGTGGDTKTTTNTYSNNTTSWLLGRLLTTQTVHALSGDNITRQASFQYNSTTGLLSQEVIEPNNASLKLTTDYTRDAYGNITQISVSGTGVTTRTTTNTFDSKKRFVATTTNPESHVEQYQYDAAFGTITSFTDPNSLVSTFIYDGFGRVTKETDPDGRYRDITYTYCTGVATGSASCTSNGAMQILSTPKRSGGSTQSGPAEAVVIDKLGRQIAEGAEAFNGTDWSLSETIYDEQGNVEKVTRPYLTSGSATQHTTFYYDVLGRPTSSVTYPDSRTDEFTYSGKITTHTKDKYGENQTTTTEINDQGLIKKVTEPGSIITQYTYYPTGDLKVTTDPASNTITLTVDTRGRITQRADPSLGTWTYQYNVFDELTDQTDAKSQDTEYVYDKLGRLTSIVASGLTSTFTYDTATNGKGRLKEMSTSDGNKRTHTYDSNGRPATTMFTIDSSTAGYTYTYNTDGRLNTVQYPSGYTVRYEYTSNRRFLQYLKEDSSGNTLWTANSRNPEGRYTQSTMNLSNSYTVDRTFDAYGRIVDVEAGASNAVADLTFTYNKLGNLTQRQDLNQSVSKRTETFTYDSMNRLTSATIDSVTRSVTYNSIGNITSKTRLGSTSTNSYTYATSGKPYAVSSITGNVNGVPNPSYNYDSNGNMTAGAGRSITWTSYNRIASVTEGSLTLSYVYDAEHQRIKQTDGTDTTYYMNDPIMGFSSEWLTTDSGTNVDYLFADGERIGVRTKKTTPSSTTFEGFVQDHLGSVAVVTDSSGAVVQRLSYDAWGRRRNPDGTEDPTGAITAPTSRGFTDHEHLPGISLINMNARMYDPEIGRFMSPDTIIPDPLKSQAYNRYSYVYNNPGSLADPTGNCPELTTCLQILGYIYQAVEAFRLLDKLFGSDTKDPIYHKPGLSGVNEDLRQSTPLRSIPNLGVLSLSGANLAANLGGSKYDSVNRSTSIMYVSISASDTFSIGQTDSFISSQDGMPSQIEKRIEKGIISGPLALPSVPAVLRGISIVRNLGKTIIRGLKGPRTPEDLLKSAKPGSVNVRGNVQQGVRDGGFRQANREFDSMKPNDVKDINTPWGKGRTGLLRDGRRVNVRPGSGEGRPTLETINPNQTSIKIRFDP